jgi:hypothetical protein
VDRYIESGKDITKIMTTSAVGRPPIFNDMQQQVVVGHIQQRDMAKNSVKVTDLELFLNEEIISKELDALGPDAEVEQLPVSIIYPDKQLCRKTKRKYNIFLRSERIDQLKHIDDWKLLMIHTITLLMPRL